MGKAKYIYLVLAVLIIAYLSNLYRKVMKFLNEYSYTYQITNIGTNLLSGVSASGLTTSFGFILNIVNPTNFKVTVSDLQIKLYYQNTFIGLSDGFSTIYIPKEGQTSFTGKANIAVNRALLNSVLQFGTGSVNIDYLATFRLYGLPFKFSYRDTKTLNLSEYI